MVLLARLNLTPVPVEIHGICFFWTQEHCVVCVLYLLLSGKVNFILQSVLQPTEEWQQQPLKELCPALISPGTVTVLHEEKNTGTWLGPDRLGGTQGEMCWGCNLIHLPRKFPSGQRDSSMQNKTTSAILRASSSYKAINTKVIKQSPTYHTHTEPVFPCTGKKIFFFSFHSYKTFEFLSIGIAAS